MYFQLDLICFHICFLQVISVTAITTNIGLFKVSRRSPQIKQCASELLSKNDSFDLLRMSESKGLCEELSGSLDEEKIEPGYEYAKRISKKESFQPSKNIQHFKQLYLKFPVVFTTGTRFSLYVTWPNEKWDFIEDELNKFEVGESTIGREKVYYEDKLPGTKCNITYAANGNNTFKILFNGRTMFTWRGQYPRLDRLNQVRIFYIAKDYDKLFLINGIEYRQG